MGCRCGQKQSMPLGAAQYSPPSTPPTLDNFASPMNAAVGVYYVVTTEAGAFTFPDMESAVAFANGEYPITRTSSPPQPV